MTREESCAEAERILEAAGWRRVPGNAAFCVTVAGQIIVVGIQPDGAQAHAKNVDWRRPGDPLYSADTPDEPHEAAQWLVDRFRCADAAAPMPPAPLEELTNLSALHPVGAEPQPERAQSESTATHDEPLTASSHETLSESPPDPALYDAEFWESDAAAEPLPEGADRPELEAPAEVDTDDSDGTPPQYIFGDNLAADRIFRQGQVSEVAAQRIHEVEQAVDEADSEFADLQAYVVSNLNEAGIFTGSDAAKYTRFVELSEARRKLASIGNARAEKISFIRTAAREAVATFDPEADWPQF